MLRERGLLSSADRPPETDERVCHILSIDLRVGLGGSLPPRRPSSSAAKPEPSFARAIRGAHPMPDRRIQFRQVVKKLSKRPAGRASAGASTTTACGSTKAARAVRRHGGRWRRAFARGRGAGGDRLDLLKRRYAAGPLPRGRQPWIATRPTIVPAALRAEPELGRRSVRHLGHARMFGALCDGGNPQVRTVAVGGAVGAVLGSPRDINTYNTTVVPTTVIQNHYYPQPYPRGGAPIASTISTGGCSSSRTRSTGPCRRSSGRRIRQTSSGSRTRSTAPSRASSAQRTRRTSAASRRKPPRSRRPRRKSRAPAPDQAGRGRGKQNGRRSRKADEEAQQKAAEEAERQQQIKQGEDEENRMAAEAQRKAEEEAERQRQIKQGEQDELNQAAGAARPAIGRRPRARLEESAQLAGEGRQGRRDELCEGRGHVTNRAHSAVMMYCPIVGMRYENSSIAASATRKNTVIGNRAARGGGMDRKWLPLNALERSRRPGSI